jgi:uncharacterized RDD family membrane protein YckC
MNNEYNPYLPPKSEVERPETRERKPFILASKWLRFANYVLDYIVVALLMSIPYFFVVSRNESIADFASIVIAFVYFTFLEYQFGQTVGKMITRTVVVNDVGNSPSLGQAMGRTVARIIPFEAFSVLFGSTSRGWHDSLASTYVIKKV